MLRGHQRNGSISSIVEIQPKGSRPPLFLVHGVGGGMFWGYTNLSRHLHPDQPIYALKSRAMDGAPEFATIEEMAAHYLADVRKVQPHGPYYLGGYCFGGNVAYEMAQQLKADGEEVAFLGLINCGPPNSGYGKIRWTPSFAIKFLKNLGYWAKHAFQWTPAQRREFVHWKLRSFKKRAERLLGRNPRQPNVDVDMLVDLSPYPEDQRRLWEAHINALIQYYPKPYPGAVTLFRSPGHQLLCSFDEQYGWGELARGGVAVKIISGAHEQILEEPHVQRVAREMTYCLDQSRCEVEVVSKRAATPAKSDALPATDLRKVLHEWNETAADYPLDQSYAGLFEEQVKQNPNAIAIRFAGQELSYSALNSRSNQLAHCLSRRGIGPESLVAIHADRSIEFAVAILAVLKAGAAYLPSDPTYPKERVAWMLADARAELVLTFGQLSPQLPAAARNVLILDDPAIVSQLRGSNPESAPAFRHSPNNLAYVIYTSGSTGTPKGVEISYRALVNHNCAIKAAYGLSSSDRVLQFTPLSFDISVEEILPSWLAGATVVFRTQEVLGSISKFLAFLERERITVANLPTAFFRALTESLTTDLPRDLRLVIIGGEKVSVEHWAMWHARVRESVELINAYGLTEATVTSTLFRSDKAARRESIPIGKPVANTTAYILDANLQPVPVGVAGELFIGGCGVARGYRNSADLTAQRFLRNPFLKGTPSVLYKTGDLARFLPDGNLEFLGRLDDQIKLRGFRIQLGEIEAALGRHPAISHVVVHAKAYGDQEERLVAYFVPLNGASIITGELIAFLQQTLPEYMIPSAFVKLDGFPLTPNGKVDHNALPLPGTNRPALSEPLVAPRTELEQKIAGVWRAVLHLDEVGINDNFFDLGAHSLHAMQVMSRLRDLLNLELPVSNLFEAPTIARLAAAITAGAAQTPSAGARPVRRAQRDNHSALSFAQQRLWFLHQLQPAIPLYNIPQAVRLEGRLNVPALERAFAEILRRHEVLRTTYRVEAGQPVQVVAPAAKSPLVVTDLSAFAPELKQRTLRDTILAEARKPFALEHDLMLRVALIKLGEDEHMLLITTHHIAADGWSIEVLWKEIASLYGTFVRGMQSPLSDLPIQYADFALWQRDWLQGDVLESQLSYWRKQLEGAPALLELPLDYSRPATQTYRGARQPLSLSPSLTESLKTLAQAEGCTLFMALLAGFQSLL
ncbi:MAG TPA: amino acid adenylation domain-containing protein, partial [Verrucomicrobiae bacterium]|nr:amino acid adenylation domain-containing protein [Verrucomicrobiae bacterium]